jgi:hypothetical protein
MVGRRARSLELIAEHTPCPTKECNPMSYRKIGGLHFVKFWRFGITFYWTRPNSLVQ